MIILKKLKNLQFWMKLKLIFPILQFQTNLSRLIKESNIKNSKPVNNGFIEIYYIQGAISEES